MGEQHLAKLAERSFERHGDYESLFFEGTWYRSGDQFERSRRLGAGLVELGIEPGDRVVVMMANTPDVGTTYTGLWRAGARSRSSRPLEQRIAGCRQRRGGSPNCRIG